MKTLSGISAAFLLMLSASLPARAQVVIANPADAPPLHSAELGIDGLDDGDIGSFTGGTVYDASRTPFPTPAPTTPIFGNTYGSFEAVTGASMIFNFVSGIHWVHFLWGVPDDSYTLTITTTLGNTFFYGPGSIPLPEVPSDLLWKQSGQSPPAYFGSGDSRIFSLDFQSLTPGEFIESITFTNTGSPDAMWVANFQVDMVPETSVWLMLILGFGMVGGGLRQRRSLKPDAVARLAV